MSTKNTILKAYDGRFKDIFQDIFEKWVIFCVWLGFSVFHVQTLKDVLLNSFLLCVFKTLKP